MSEYKQSLWIQYIASRGRNQGGVMAREKEDYRANLERLNELYPDHEMLTVLETMKLWDTGA